MAANQLVSWLAQCLSLYPQTVGDGLDEATRERMRQHEELLRREMTRLLEQLEQSSSAGGALGFSALQQWQFWAVAGVLLLLLEFRRRLRKRNRDLNSHSNEESSKSSREQDKEPEGEDSDNVRELNFAIDILRPVEELVDELLCLLDDLSSAWFVPVLEPAIRVGNAFRGWSLHKDGGLVYRLLLPLKPPPGHTFHLEPDNKDEKPERNFRVRVELECTCTREELRGIMLCFLHHPKEELRSNQSPSLLDILCTRSYLDVHRTARWLKNFVRSAWGVVPQMCGYNMEVLPSSHSCKLQLTDASGRHLFVELIFAVHQDDSDALLTCQTTEGTFTPLLPFPRE